MKRTTEESFVDLLDTELEALKKKQQAANRALGRVARGKKRVDQRIGARVVQVAPEIRLRAMRVFDAIVADEKMLAKCERVIAGETEFAAAAE